MSVLHGLWHGLDEGFFMFWETLWALVLGFGLSGAVQAFVSRGEMQRVLGTHRPATLGKASIFGVISSSCSYAATALAKSLFARGADFTASLVFMIASTNLVVELGIVLWLLIGWQFALAEFVGGAIMIALLGLVAPRVFPARLVAPARDRLNSASEEADPHAHHGEPAGGPDERLPLRRRLRSRAGWGDAAGYTISDLTMLRRELVIGFVVAGYLAALVPTAVWHSLFLTGHGFWSSLQNVVLGPFLAIISFVCSVGNVPLAAAIWAGGISFGGVVSFVFADLITLPLLVIYRKYFGTALTVRILAVFWATMAIAGLATEYLFRAAGIPEPARPRKIVDTGFAWNYTTVLNIVALAAFAGIYWLYRHRDTSSGRYAKDPVCGMQVELAHAPATASAGGQQLHFCSDHCADRFRADPARYRSTPAAAPAAHTAAGPGQPHGEAHGAHAEAHGDDQDRHSAGEAGTAAATDPVCGMTVDPTSTAHLADIDTEDGARRVLFCGPGCRQQYLHEHPGAHAHADATRGGGGDR